MAYAGRLGETSITGCSAATFIYAMELAGYECLLDCGCAIHMKRLFRGIKRLRAGFRMEDKFDTVAYVKDIGSELVASFAAAGRATTPGLVGSAREHPIRKKLEHLLPGGLAVGTGCIIDSYGGISRQMDIVLHEKHLCPVYSVNDDPNATYFPCEGVIAVGEVKSCVRSADMRDIFAKVASAKKLRRYVSHDSDGASHVFGLRPTLPYRSYGSSDSIVGDEDEQFDQDHKSIDQIFGFSIAGTFELEEETICRNYVALAKEFELKNSPNCIVALEGDKVVRPLHVTSDGKKLSIASGPNEANVIGCGNPPQNSFQFLVSTIYEAYRQGRTVPEIAFNRYFSKDGGLVLKLNATVRLD